MSFFTALKQTDAGLFFKMLTKHDFLSKKNFYPKKVVYVFGKWLAKNELLRIPITQKLTERKEQMFKIN